jgi:hypothetical protein
MQLLGINILRRCPDGTAMLLQYENRTLQIRDVYVEPFRLERIETNQY